MTTPILDFSHLTPEEQIELAEQLWYSIDSEAVQPADEQVAELLRRRAELAGDDDPRGRRSGSEGDCRARRVMPRLFVRRAARANIADAYGWYGVRRTGLGHEFLRSMRVAFAEIARGPEQYPITLDDVRKLALRHFPCVIYFVVTPRDAVVGPEFFEPLRDE